MVYYVVTTPTAFASVIAHDDIIVEETGLLGGAIYKDRAPAEKVALLLQGEVEVWNEKDTLLRMFDGGTYWIDLVAWRNGTII